MTAKFKLITAGMALLVLVAAPFTISVRRNDARAQEQPQTSEKSEPLVKPTILETPVTSTPQYTSDTITAPEPVKTNEKPDCDQRANPYCYGTHGVDEYGTPIPEVKTTQPAQPWVRSDGYFNYCYQMPDSSWTTVTGKLELGKGIYYYGGEIDPATEAPAYAVESQQWCASHLPPEAQ